MASLVGRLEELERPAEVIDAALAVIGERFRDEGFVWVKSRSMMRRTVDGRQESPRRFSASFGTRRCGSLWRPMCTGGRSVTAVEASWANCFTPR